MLDRLCAQAVVYDRAYSTSSWTLPAHASLFTGLHTAAHGATNDPEGPLLLHDVLPEKSAEGHRVQGLSQQMPTLASLASDAGYATAGFVAGPWMKQAFGLGRGFGLWDDSEIDALNGRRAESLSDAALGWLERGHARPFLLFLNYYDPHSPFDPPAGWRPPGAPASGQIPDLEQAWSLYDAEIRYMDHHLGRVLDALRGWKLFDDTLILVTADHGELMGEHGVAGHGRFLYEEEIRIPFIVKWPHGSRPPGRDPGPIQLTDVPQLLLPAMGLPVPEHARAGRPLLAELRPAPQFAGRGNWRVLIDGPDKFVWNSKGRHRLYDLSRRAAEETNRIAEHPDKASALESELGRYLATLPKPAVAPSLTPIDEQTRRALEGLGYLMPEQRAEGGPDVDSTP